LIEIIQIGKANNKTKKNLKFSKVGVAVLCGFGYKFRSIELYMTYEIMKKYQILQKFSL